MRNTRPTTTQRPFFVFIGSSDSESAVSKLKTSGSHYRKKILESHIDNWGRIIEILRDPQLRAVVANFTRHTYDLLAAPGYFDTTPELLDALSSVPHVVFVHEAVLMSNTRKSDDSPADEPVGEDDEVSDEQHFYGMTRNDFFGQVDEAVRVQVNQALEVRHMNVLPYRTNAERSVMSAAFIDDHERQLLFRVYIPSGRLYAAEAEKLLSLFQEWLGQTGQATVRREGYRTRAGQVFEFFGGSRESSKALSQQFQDFSGFLDRCIQDPDAAANELVGVGIDKTASFALVTKYGREVRRLQMDLRHTREERMLSLAHRLEAELVDGEVVEPASLQQLVSALVPAADPSAGFRALAGSPMSLAQGAPVNVTINQQIVHHVQGTVAQSVAGTINLGPEPRALLDLIQLHAGPDKAVLESAVLELEDDTARPGERLQARQRLKAFVARVSGHLETTAISLLEKYLESKMGLS